MYSVMRILFTPDKGFVCEFLSLDSNDHAYWSRWGTDITSFNDKALAQEWVDKLNLEYDCEVCDISYGPEY